MLERILVIDDEDVVRKLIVSMLTRAGYETLEAPNGRIGIAVARHERPALILCDGVMPELDGMSTLEEIREDDELSDIPFIFVSGNEVDGSRERAGDLRADSYLSKPFRKEELLAAITDALADS